MPKRRGKITLFLFDLYIALSIHTTEKCRTAIEHAFIKELEKKTCKPNFKNTE